jgi:hypothetical protein
MAADPSPAGGGSPGRQLRPAAIGGSDQAAPATVDRYLAELDAVLDAASPCDPVILAGHALGGLIARLYQHARPSRVSGPVLLDSTPEAVADERGVQAGFVASGLAARLLKLLTPMGFTWLLLRWQKMPLYPEQSHYQAAVSPPEYDRWLTMVCQSFGRGAGAELRSVIPTAAQAKKLLAGHTVPVPLAVIASSAFGDKWVSWQHETATLSATGSFTFTGTKSHNIHLRHAATVTAAIGEIAAQPAQRTHSISRNGHDARAAHPARSRSLTTAVDLMLLIRHIGRHMRPLTRLRRTRRNGRSERTLRSRYSPTDQRIVGVRLA